LVDLAKSCQELKSINVDKCEKLTDVTIRAIARHCKSLESIDVSSCRKLTDGDLAEVMESCRHLKSIHVNSCVNLTDKTIRAITRNCKSLEFIDVDWCQELTDGGLVELTKSCHHLKTIAFSYTKLSQLPDNIGNLNNLRHLDVAGNNIKKLPRSIVNLPPDCVLRLGGNNLQEPPFEIAEKGIDAIARYFEDRDRAGATISRKLKVVLVGHGCDRKTSLRRAMAGNDHPLVPAGPEGRTIYLDLKHIQLESDTQDPLTILVYDCGGQPEYAMGQAPFLTGSSLFILVVPVDEANENYYNNEVLRFLVLLQSRAPGAVVQLVLSKCDRDRDRDRDRDSNGFELKKERLKDKVDKAALLRRSKDTACVHRGDPASTALTQLQVLPRSLIYLSGTTLFTARRNCAAPFSRNCQSFQVSVSPSQSHGFLCGNCLEQCVDSGPDCDPAKLFEEASSEDAVPVNAMNETVSGADGSYGSYWTRSKSF
jgi:hypothetical protein